VPVGGRQAAGRVAEMREWVGFSLQEEVAESSPRPVLGSVGFCGYFMKIISSLRFLKQPKNEDSLTLNFFKEPALAVL
jgi:hypothetical protein